MFVGSATLLIALMGLSSTPVDSKAIAVEHTLHPRLLRVINSTIISPEGELIAVRDLLHKRVGDMSPSDPCDKGTERWAYERSNEHAEETSGETERVGSRFCCCPYQDCTQTQMRSYAKGKSFSVGFNAGADGQNLAGAAADAARTASGSFGFDFSYGWSETFTSTESVSCPIDTPGLTVAVGEFQRKPCSAFHFRPRVVKTTWTQKRRNMCDSNAEWEEYDAWAEEPIVINGLRQGEWTCPYDGDHESEVCGNYKTYGAGESRAPETLQADPTPTVGENRYQG